MSLVSLIGVLMVLGVVNVPVLLIVEKPMTLEEQIRLHKEISLKLEELEEQKKALGLSILEAMQGKSLQMGFYLVKRYTRLSISMTLDQARLYNAVKMEEVVDKEKIKTLYKNGTPVPGVKECEYIVVSIQNNALVLHQV